jgi:hypothetical protein
MNNIVNYKKRFFSLMESTMGNVKPLITEKIGDSLGSGEFSKRAKITKKEASFLNSYYSINLDASVTGNWHDKDFNDYLKKFMEEKGIEVWICKKGDGYCHDDAEGEVTTQEYDKLRQAMSESPKINVSHDKSYDYKLENGKYYYSRKGKNKWIEAKGRGLNAIKEKVKFN